MKLEAKAAAPLFLRFLDKESTGHFSAEDILKYCRKLDANVAENAARKLANSQMPGLKLQCGLILIDVGDREAGMQLIGKALAGAGYSNFSGDEFRQGIDALLEEGSGESQRLITRALEGNGLATIYRAESKERQAIVDALVKA